MDEARDLHGDVLGLLAIKPAESDAPSINAPDGVAWGSCLSVVYGLTRQLLLMDAKGIHYQSFDGISWSPWRPVAFTTPPQEFDLPLADGIIALQPCIYWKNQFEEVTIYGCTYGEVTEGDTIATLPEGFRPDHPVEWPASFTGDAGRVSGTVFISESGIVSIHTPAPAMSVVFAASFLTAS